MLVVNCLVNLGLPLHYLDLNIRGVLQLSVKKHKLVRHTYLSPEEEALVVATAEIGGAHGLSMETANILAEL